jgi:ribosomal protein L25 (general stress protein Ctc)
MATEKLGFTDRDQRNDKARQLRTEGKKHIICYSTHENNSPQILYVVTWDEPVETKTVVGSGQ